jgi:hypothetical protein
MLGSNLALDTGLVVPPGKCPSSTSIRPRMHPSKSLTIHHSSLIYQWCYTVYIQIVSQTNRQKFLRNLLHSSQPKRRYEFLPKTSAADRFCGLVFRVSGYRSKGPGFDSRRFQIFWEPAGLERGPLSLVKTTEELLGRNSSGSGQDNRD